MGMPSCNCIPPDGDDWTVPWIRECDWHKRQRENWRAAVLAEREACAVLCDVRSADHWHDYKDGPLGVRGMPRSEHASDEAEGCAAAIRARGE